MIEYEVGQIRKDRRNNPTCAVMITKIYERHYPKSGDTATRISAIGSGETGIDMDVDLDARSFEKMFPVLMFNPPVKHDPDENK